MNDACPSGDICRKKHASLLILNSQQNVLDFFAICRYDCCEAMVVGNIWLPLTGENSNSSQDSHTLMLIRIIFDAYLHCRALSFLPQFDFLSPEHAFSGRD